MPFGIDYMEKHDRLPVLNESNVTLWFCNNKKAIQTSAHSYLVTERKLPISPISASDPNFSPPEAYKSSKSRLDREDSLVFFRALFSFVISLVRSRP
jgi:hypothetical protein